MTKKLCQISVIQQQDLAYWRILKCTIQQTVAGNIMVTTDRAGHTHVHTRHGALRVFMLMSHLWAKRKSDADKSPSEGFLLHSSVMLTTAHRFEKEMYFCLSETAKCLYVGNEKNKMNALRQGIPLFSGAARRCRGRIKISVLSQQSSQALCGEERLRHSSSSTTVAGRGPLHRCVCREKMSPSHIF